MKIEEISFFALAYGGAAIGRIADGRICFVPGALPGETAKVRIVAEKKRFVSGELQELTVRSANRIDAPCALYGRCPGCSYMHCTYETEIKWKDQQLRDFLVRNRLADEAVFLPPFPAPERFFYRNKLTLHGGDGGEAGYYALDNETVIPVPHCQLAQEPLNALLPQRGVEKILLRFTEKDGARKISGASNEVLHESVPGAGEFEVGGEGFFQVNLPVASELVKMVESAVTAAGGREVLELYCGVGVFSIALAGKISGLRCTGIELNKKAIEFAKLNAQKHGVAQRCRFFAQDAGKDLSKFRNRRDLIMLLDPPRGGVEKATLQKVIAVNASTVIYISCAADTLARDLKEFVAAGYMVDSVRMLDMFPCTAHFESLTVLKK